MCGMRSHRGGEVTCFEVVLVRDGELDRPGRPRPFDLDCTGERLALLQPRLHIVRPARHGDDYPGAQVFVRNAAQRAYVGEQDLVEVGRSSDQVSQERCIPLSKAEVAKLAPGRVRGGCAETPKVDYLLDPERDIACDLAAPSLEVPAKQGSAERCPRLAAPCGVELVDREGLRPERVDHGKPEVGDEGVISGSGLPRNPRDD